MLFLFNPKDIISPTSEAKLFWRTDDPKARTSLKDFTVNDVFFSYNKQKWFYYLYDGKKYYHWNTEIVDKLFFKL